MVVPVAVEVLLIEFATVPPIVLLLQVHVTPEPVLVRKPYIFAAPVLEFPAVMPPIVLLFVVQLFEPKLKIPITSEALAELEVYVMLPVIDWLPIVLLFAVASPAPT